MRGIKYMLRGILTAALACIFLSMSGCGGEAENDTVTDADSGGNETNQIYEEDEKMNSVKGWLYNGYDKLSESGELPRDSADDENL